MAKISIRFPAFSGNRKSKIQNLKWGRIVAIGLALALVVAVAQAQQPGKIFRIGLLDNSTTSGGAVLLEAFRQEMRKHGWIEGKNITIESRFAEGRNDRFPELAANLVRLNVDVIVVTTVGPALAVKSAYHPHRNDVFFGPRGCWSDF